MDVKEFFEKSLSFGLGLAAYSKEKIEDLVEEMVRRGEVSRTEARDFASKLTQKGEEQRDELKRLIRSEIAAALKEAGLVHEEKNYSADRPSD